MNNRINGIIVNDSKLQLFLKWADQKTNSLSLKNITSQPLYNFPYRKIAVKAFYANIAFQNIYLDPALAVIRPHLRDFNCKRYLEQEIEVDYALTLALNRARFILINCTKSVYYSQITHQHPSKITQGSTFQLFRTIDKTLSFSRSFEIPSSSLNLQYELTEDLKLDLTFASNSSNYSLRQILLSIKNKLPDSSKNLFQWWRIHGEKWIIELYKILTSKFNIGHNWQFTTEQLELLDQYYAANLLLVECMNRSYVSKQVREEIESTMLLPSKK
jgi:hypothetical protein